MNNLNDFVNASYTNAVEHGWWEEERSFGDLISLIHSELSEALEDYRNGRKPTEIYYENGVKPCGVPTELADVLIRVFDMCGRYDIDLDAVVKEKMDYNRTREYRHGHKKM